MSFFNVNGTSPFPTFSYTYRIVLYNQTHNDYNYSEFRCMFTMSFSTMFTYKIYLYYIVQQIASLTKNTFINIFYKQPLGEKIFNYNCTTNRFRP